MRAVDFFENAVDPFKRLFWRAQIRILRACPPLAGVVSKVNLGAAYSRRVWLKTLFQTAAQAPGALFLHGRNQREGRIVAARVTLFITTRCTLSCDKCIAHVPDRASRGDIPLQELARDIRCLLSCVDHIYDVFLTGGETLLHPDLDEIIRICVDSGKVSHVSVPTNGTVLPEAKTLAALRNPKVTVKISRYPAVLQPDADTLKSLLRENGIRFTHASGAFWFDTGDGRLQAGSEKRRFSVCLQQLCFFCFHGKLHVCSEGAFLVEAGLAPDCKEDYIDLRSVSPAAFQGEWRALLKKRTLSTCSHCLGHTYKSPKVPVAVQRKK